jgi:hypothetical protein
MNFENRVTEIGNEIESGLKEMRRFAGEAVPTTLALPEYVTHAPEVNDVGRLSSQALAAEYEKAAKEVEAVGVALVNSMQQCESDAVAAIKELEHVRELTLDTIKSCQDTATAYRDEAKRLFGRIQQSAMLAEDVRRICAQLTERVNNGGDSSLPQDKE